MALKVNYDKTNIDRIDSIRNALAKLYTQRNICLKIKQQKRDNLV